MSRAVERAAATLDRLAEALGERPSGHMWCVHERRYSRWDECVRRAASPCRGCGRQYAPGDTVVADDCRWWHAGCAGAVRYTEAAYRTRKGGHHG